MGSPGNGGSEGILMSLADSPVALSADPVLSPAANPAVSLLSSVCHLGPVQLHHHPPSEHRGGRVDDVSSVPSFLWGSGRRAHLLLLCPIRAGLGRPPRPLLGVAFTTSDSVATTSTVLGLTLDGPEAILATPRRRGKEGF